MVKEEKTIDGFSVRRAKDSALVARSKANKLPQNKKIKTASNNDPLVKKRAGAGTRKTTIVKPTLRPKKSVTRKKTVRPEAEDDGAVSVKISRAEAHEEFLAPVETFDFDTQEEKEEERVAEEEQSEELGEIEEVEDEEVVNLKRSEKARKRVEKEQKKEKKKKSKARKVVKIILILLVLAIIGAGVYMYFWGNGIIKKMTGGEGDVWSAIGALTSETYEPLKADENGRTNILVFGTSGYDMKGDVGGGTHDGAQLTDSIMVVSLNQETGDIAMVSLPRDLKANGTRSGNFPCTATGKVNEVYYCNNLYGENEAEGAAALQNTIKYILGIDTQYYVHMNWGALVNIVDALGGVTVTLDEDINDRYWTGAVYSAGVEYTLNGEEALGLSRARHGTDYGDFTRGNSQQKILIAIKNKVVEKGLGLSEAMAIINAVGDNVRMNLNMSEIKTGMHLLEEFDLDNMRQIALVGDTYYMSTANINGISYVVPSAGVDNYTKLQEYIALKLKNSAAEREGAEILVLNGTGEAGVAAEERAYLEKKGYLVKEIANAPEGEYQYTADIEVYDTSEGKAPDTRKALEKLYSVTAKEEAELPNGISGVGYDFIIIVGGAA